MKAVRKGIILTAAAIASIACAGPAMADAVIDQQASVDACQAGCSAWFFEGQSVAQPFTAGMTGALTRADLSVAPWSNTQSNMTVEIYEMTSGVPTGTALATTSIPVADIQSMQPDRTLNTLTVNFASPAAITAGTQYAIVASTTAGEGYHWFMSSMDGSGAHGIGLYGDTRTTGVAGASWGNFYPGAYITWVDGSYVFGSHGSGGSTSAGSSGSPSIQWSLSFSSKGEERTALTPAGSPGWMELPVIEAAGRSGERFLGWSTSPSFPTSVAVHQIDNGWGAIDDVFDGERMIFIPAGDSTQISGSNHFYAVWG